MMSVWKWRTSFFSTTTMRPKLAVEKGEVFGVDVPHPTDGTYVITGASFDPALFRMERYLEYEDGGEPRVRYLFTGLAERGGRREREDAPGSRWVRRMSTARCGSRWAGVRAAFSDRT